MTFIKYACIPCSAQDEAPEGDPAPATCWRCGSPTMRPWSTRIPIVREIN